MKTDVPYVPKADAKQQFGIDPDDMVVAIPGFIRPPKGHDIFVEVARHLPECEFLVAGGARPKGEDFEFADRIRREAPEIESSARLRAPCSAQRTVTTD